MTDDEELIEKTAAAEKAAKAAVESMKLECVWCGLGSLPVQEFKARGGMDIGFMSVTRDKHLASKDSLRIYEAEKAVNEQKRHQTMTAAKPRASDPVPETLLDDGDEQEEASEEEDEEEKVYLPLAMVPTLSATGGADVAAGRPESPELEGGGHKEVSIRILKVFTTSEAMMPVNISEFSLVPTEHEWFYPPGIIIDYKREFMDSLGVGAEGEDAYCKGAEVHPRLLKPSWVKVSKSGSAVH